MESLKKYPGFFPPETHFPLCTIVISSQTKYLPGTRNHHFKKTLASTGKPQPNHQTSTWRWNANVSSFPSNWCGFRVFPFKFVNETFTTNLAPRLSASPGHPAVANASPIECPAGVKLFCAASTGPPDGHPAAPGGASTGTLFWGNFSTHCNLHKKGN